MYAYTQAHAQTRTLRHRPRSHRQSHSLTRCIPRCAPSAPTLTCTGSPPWDQKVEHAPHLGTRNWSMLPTLGPETGARPIPHKKGRWEQYNSSIFARPRADLPKQRGDLNLVKQPCESARQKADSKPQRGGRPTDFRVGLPPPLQVWTFFTNKQPAHTASWAAAMKEVPTPSFPHLSLHTLDKAAT